MSAVLDVRGLGATFPTPRGAPLRVLDGITFTVGAGELVCLVGPSGCGKTTLLQIIGGLRRASEGEVLVEGRRVTGPPPELVVLFQQYGKSLLPWRTVEGNVSLALENLDLATDERRPEIDPTTFRD